MSIFICIALIPRCSSSVCSIVLCTSAYHSLSYSFPLTFYVNASCHIQGRTVYKHQLLTVKLGQATCTLPSKRAAVVVGVIVVVVDTIDVIGLLCAVGGWRPHSTAKRYCGEQRPLLTVKAQVCSRSRGLSEKLFEQFSNLSSLYAGRSKRLSSSSFSSTMYCVAPRGALKDSQAMIHVLPAATFSITTLPMLKRHRNQTLPISSLLNRRQLFTAVFNALQKCSAWTHTQAHALIQPVTHPL